MIIQIIKNLHVAAPNPKTPIQEVEDFLRFDYTDNIRNANPGSKVLVDSIRLLNFSFIVVIVYTIPNEESLTRFIDYLRKGDVLMEEGIKGKADLISCTIVKTDDDGKLISSESLESYLG